VFNINSVRILYVAACKLLNLKFPLQSVLFIMADSSALVHAVRLVLNEFTTGCHITSDLVLARAGGYARARVCVCVELVEWKS